MSGKRHGSTMNLEGIFDEEVPDGTTNAEKSPDARSSDIGCPATVHLLSEIPGMTLREPDLVTAEQQRSNVCRFGFSDVEADAMSDAGHAAALLCVLLQSYR